MSNEYFQGEELLRLQGDFQYNIDQVVEQISETPIPVGSPITTIASTTLSVPRVGETVNINLPTTFADAHTFANVITFQKPLALTRTITPTGTTGNQTIDEPAGTINIAAAGTSVVLTNNLITVNSIVIPVLRTNDTTAKSVAAVAAAGTCTFYLNAAATAEVSIGFIVTN